MFTFSLTCFGGVGLRQTVDEAGVRIVGELADEDEVEEVDVADEDEGDDCFDEDDLLMNGNNSGSFQEGMLIGDIPRR